MKKSILMSIAMGIATSAISAQTFASEKTDPEFDRQKLVEYFQKRHRDVPVEAYVDGIYMYSEDLRSQWEADNEFPPFEEQVAKGQTLWETPFANGKTYASCYEGKALSDIKPSFPYFDDKRGEVVTLELSLNECREANGEKPMAYSKGDIASVTGYLAQEARGQKVQAKVDSEGALKAYEEGKYFFYAKRGQLNLSCADCHVYQSGRNARANILSPTLGHVTHWPTYRKAWGELGTLHRRFKGCQENMRAMPSKVQGNTYRNLELFMTYMSNGLEYNGPAVRG
jgi:sulfur-oxidizing protein SoxA